MVALELTVAVLLLAQAPPASPVTITFRPPVVGEIQVLRILRESDVRDRMFCLVSGGNRADCSDCARVSEVIDRQARVVAVRGGRLLSYQVAYQQRAVRTLPCIGAPVLTASPVMGFAFLVTTTASRSWMTDLQGARLTERQESALLQDHLALVDLRDLHLSQRRLVVTNGARVPVLETALRPLRRRFWMYSFKPATIVVRFAGTELRRGRPVALFSVQGGPASPGFRALWQAYDGCLGLEMQTGRLESLELKPVPGVRGAFPQRTFPATKLTFRAEYH